MNPSITNIDTSGSNCLKITNVNNLIMLIKKGDLSITLMPDGETVIFVNTITSTVVWKTQVGTDTDITITDGVTPVVYDGSTPGTNDAPAMIDDLRDSAF